MGKAKSAKHVPIYGADWFTPLGRGNFIHLAHPVQFDGKGEFKYSLNQVCNQGPKLSQVLADIDSVSERAHGRDDAGKLKGRLPYALGEDILDAIEDPSESTIQLYSGRVRLVASSGVKASKKGKPFEPPKCYLSDGALMPRREGSELDLAAIERQFYDGCFLSMAVTPFSYWQSKDVFGVSLILRAVKFGRDGARLGGINVDSLVTQEMVEEGSWDDDDEGSGQEEMDYSAGQIPDGDADTEDAPNI